MPRSMPNPQVHIYESEYRMIYAAAREFISDETGGDLYGTFTHGDMPIIWLASGPGPRVHRNRVHFEQDTSFTTVWQRRLMNQFGIQYIGSWHSHHSLGLREPSSGDRESAKIYALNHNRSKTLEIIVTHERNNETVLWFYFYPDAVHGILLRAEPFFLPGVSPLRKQLDANEEREFSGNTNWKLGRLPEALESRNARGSVPDATDSDQQVDIPVELNEEFESISSYLEDVTVGNTVVVRLSVDEALALDVSIDPASRMLVRVEIFDKVKRSKLDITPYIQRQPFSLMIRPKSHVLRQLLMTFPTIRKELAVRQAELENQARLESLSSLPNESPAKSSAGANGQDNQRGQQIPPADVESAAKEKQVEDVVYIYSEKNKSGHYDITIKTGNRLYAEQIHAALIQMSVLEEQILSAESANNTFTVLTEVMEVKHVVIVLTVLSQVFENIKIDCDKETRQELQQIIPSQEGGNKEGVVTRLWRFLF